ncbi:MAG TPA: MYXO-CTERM sorting domain-containing protein [Polyangia bacterium]|nr:MYXO-CTERM sorting domain-containing protein [Polyangia bacterium]
MCRACLTSADCDPKFPVCLSTGACAVCTPTDTSHCAASAPLCDTTGGGGVCVACLGNADCGGTTPVCSATTHTCTGCVADGGPSCPDPAHPVCQKTGPLAGACTECSATNGAACVGLEPLCIVATGLCGCTTDVACGGATSGFICSGPNGFCEPGCGPGHNGCPTNQTCSVTSGVGTCTTTTSCAADGDCAAPLGRCDMTEGLDRCVQCLVDTDCAAPFVCDTSMHTCAECTTANQSACRVDLSGGRCVAGGSCGCAMDTDCGGATSGRICDPTSARCVPGCRTTGGNGCPASLVCTATGTAAGVCQQPPPSPDGGADAGRDAATDAPIDAPTTDGHVADGAVDAPISSDAARDGNADQGDVSGGGGAGGAGGAAGYLAGGGYVAGGGCRCDATGAGGSSSALALLALALGSVIRRRRRR